VTRSRVLWFFAVLAVATPVLLLALTLAGRDGLTGEVWGNSLVMAAGLATANALVRGKREAADR
jgi:hypothetical protein